MGMSVFDNLGRLALRAVHRVVYND
jgi:hypothetical protein